MPKPLRNAKKWTRYVNESIKGMQEKPFKRRLETHMKDVLAGKTPNEFNWKEVEALAHRDKRDVTYERRFRDLIQNILVQTTMNSAGVKQLDTKQRAAVKQMLLARIGNATPEQSNKLRARASEILGTEKYLEVVETIDELIRILGASRKPK